MEVTAPGLSRCGGCGINAFVYLGCSRAGCARLSRPQELRDVDIGRIEVCRGQLPESVYRRCPHVITENARVHACVDALEHPADLARAMAEPHRSLRDNYQESCFELDEMVEAAQGTPGLLGTRMTGGASVDAP